MTRQIHLAIWMLRVRSMFIQLTTLFNSVCFLNYVFQHLFHEVCIFSTKPANYYHMHIYTVIICMYKVTFHQI